VFGGARKTLKKAILNRLTARFYDFGHTTGSIHPVSFPVFNGRSRQKKENEPRVRFPFEF
jgi:hypothetical protein